MLNYLLYNNFLCPGEKQVHFHNVLKVLYFRLFTTSGHTFFLIQR